jgi:Fe-S-cluster-containing dehydrogenase component
MKPYELIIRHELCWGCRACEVACKQENGAPDGIHLISVWQDGPRIRDGKLDVVFQVTVCRHCDDPPCVDACPEEAISKREDGMVILDDEKCLGCGLCQEACPYDAIAMDAVNGAARKCNLCHHRVDRGLVPACADNVCPAHCIYFGDPEKSPGVFLSKSSWS